MDLKDFIVGLTVAGYGVGCMCTGYLLHKYTHRNEIETYKIFIDCYESIIAKLQKKVKELSTNKETES